MTSATAQPRWLVVVAAALLLNVPLAMANLWPTPFPRLTANLSAEAALAVLALTFFPTTPVGGRPGLRRWLATLWVLLTFGRYAAMTAQSLWGRDINLYWDMPHLPAVGAMLAFVADPRALAGVAAAFVVVPLLLYLPYRWAFGQLISAASQPRRRRPLRALAAAVLVIGLVQAADEGVPRPIAVVEPVTWVWARQARQYVVEASGRGLHELGPAPVLPSELGRLAGADVFLIFVESYGAVSWERPEFAQGLAPVRERFAAAVRETGRDVVSAFVESPTFGGESWLAHVSLLSGTEVRDGATNVRLLAQKRDTMVTAFTRAGYRTMAIMPGLQRPWSEGAFYGFDVVYDANRLGYGGPSFGWWDVTDQFALAKVDAVEVAKTPRPPVFIVFPTISTHTPFIPTPPYEPDWTRVLGDEPYTPEALEASYSETADWLDLSPGYIKALTYDFDTLGGYLRLRQGRDLVMILIGDHQPPALVAGEGAPWDVPVHVIASRPEILRALTARGFSAGLAPSRPALGKMHTLVPALLGAFAGGD